MEQQSVAGSSGQLPMVNVNAGRGNVLNRVTNQQDKWKKQVRVRALLSAFHSFLFSLPCQNVWSSGPRTAVENLQPTFNVELKLSLEKFLLNMSEDGVCFNSRMSCSIPKRFTNNNKKILFSSPIISSDDRHQTPPDDRASSHWENIHQIFNFSPTSTRRSSDIGTSFPTEIITLCVSRVLCRVFFVAKALHWLFVLRRRDCGSSYS